MQEKYVDQINKLTKEEYYVTQENGTEAPFNNKYDNHFEQGIYVDIVSKKVLFSSVDKFNSGCGWPAFSKPISKDVVVENGLITRVLAQVDEKVIYLLLYNQIIEI